MARFYNKLPKILSASYVLKSQKFILYSNNYFILLTINVYKGFGLINICTITHCVEIFTRHEPLTKRFLNPREGQIASKTEKESQLHSHHNLINLKIYSESPEENLMKW